MPDKGQAWQWQHVCIDNQDVQIRATCNGTTATAGYYSQQQGGGRACENPDTYPYSFPIGSVTDTSYAGGCTEAAVLAWASDPATFVSRH